jgi:cation transport ATPase
MDPKSEILTLENDLIQRANKHIEDHARTAGKKLIDEKIEEGLAKFEDESNLRVKTFKEKLKRNFARYKLNLHSTVLFLLCLQLSISFVLLLLLYVFSFILALILIWVLMFVGCIYCGSYCLISKYPSHFRKSSSTFAMCVILAVCEAVVLCFMSMAISYEVFLIEVFMIIVSLFDASLLAKCLRNRYKAKAGLMMALMTTASIYIIFFFLVSDARVWMTVCTLLVCGYEWFLVNKVSAIIKELEENEEDDKFQTGLYASLLIFKAKIDLFVFTGKLMYEKCCKQKQPPNNQV